MRAAVKLCISDCIADRVRLGVAQPTEWQRIVGALTLPARAYARHLLKPNAPSVCSGVWVPGGGGWSVFIEERANSQFIPRKNNALL
jgi:hypothetical protein